ncbi:MAG: hypothetical protein M3280_01305 [Actinomycetota bacterium]|nr:hypothetical protein [Actinomycetota bacterium]
MVQGGTRRNPLDQSQKGSMLWPAIVIVLAVLAIVPAAEGQARPPRECRVRVKAADNPRTSGRLLADAIEAIDEDGPCRQVLVEIGEGRFRLNEPIDLPEFVDIDGAGRRDTTIVSEEEVFVLVPPTDDYRFRFLRVVSQTGGRPFDWAIPGRLVDVIVVGGLHDDGYSDKRIMVDVSVVERSGPEASVGFLGGEAILRDVNLHGPNLSFEDVRGELDRVHVSAIDRDGTREIGLSPLHSEIRISDSSIEAEGAPVNIGIRAYSDLGASGTLRVDHSTISGSTNSIWSGADYSSDSTQENVIKITRLVGGPVRDDQGSITKCFRVYDENEIFYRNTCP